MTDQLPDANAGRLRCHACGAWYDPDQCTILGLAVAPSAFCVPCDEGHHAAGRWQQVARYEAARAATPAVQAPAAPSRPNPPHGQAAAPQAASGPEVPRQRPRRPPRRTGRPA